MILSSPKKLNSANEPDNARIRLLLTDHLTPDLKFTTLFLKTVFRYRLLPKCHPYTLPLTSS
ncbi:MAG: hypothetical protein JWM28_3340 [Chitinophagaceae bacterium]|nr:hypothetical protein [Chitinophagaceae bacterium]